MIAMRLLPCLTTNVMSQVYFWMRNSCLCLSLRILLKLATAMMEDYVKTPRAILLIQAYVFRSISCNLTTRNLMLVRTLKDVSDATANPWSTNTMPNGTKKKRSTTLVLDLDETLVHSTLDHCVDADFTFPVYVDMKEHIVYVKKRPFLHTCLERVTEMFEIVIFTASQSIYVKQLLDTLDPDQNIISRRAYRESCIFADGCYTKDLTVLGVDLAKIAIIDNTPEVFRFQVNNGIPIKSWFDDRSDCVLIMLLPFLETLVDVEDVRPIIAKKFGNKEYE